MARAQNFSGISMDLQIRKAVTGMFVRAGRPESGSDCDIVGARAGGACCAHSDDMNRTNHIANRKVLGLMMVVSLLGQVALAGWHGGAMAATRAKGDPAVSSVLICAGGTLRQLAIRIDGSPGSDSETPSLASVCVLCATLASSAAAIEPDIVTLGGSARTTQPEPSGVIEQRSGRMPSVRNGHDPPFFSPANT